MAVEPKAQAEAMLLKADVAYGIHAGADAVQKALNHNENGSPFYEWVIQCLGTENLLTPDELAIYTALDHAGSVDEMAESQDLAQVQSVTEEEMKSATEELRRSTLVLQKQTEVLQLQNQALDRSIQKQTGNDRRRRDLEIVQRRKWENEHKQLCGEVESLSYLLERRIEDLIKEAAALTTQIPNVLGDALRSDNKLLSSLEKLGRELDRKDPQEPKTIEKIREICLRLIKTSVETIRTRLDRVYLETLTSAVYKHDAVPPSSTELKDIGDELESLYAEILPVAQMSIDQQRLEPAIKGVSSRDGRTAHHSAIALDYICDCLEHVLEKTNRLSQHIQCANNYHAQSVYLAEIGREELAAPTHATQQPASTSVLASPARRPSPIRVRGHPGTQSRRRSSGIPEMPAIDNLFEILGIQTPIDEKTGKARLAQLSRLVDDRNAKRDDIVKNAQDSYEAIVTSHLDDLRTAVQLLSDSVLAETTFNEVKFVDPDFEASIILLNSEIENAREGLSRLEMKHTGKKSEKRDDLVNRWTT